MTNPPIRKPICPTFIHDDTTKIVICVVGIIICYLIYYQVFKYFNKY